MTAPVFVAIALELETQAPLRVGAPADAAIDLPVAVDADGRPHVPGSGVAGALRATFAAEPEWFWGSADDDGAASLVSVPPAEITLAPTATPHPLRTRTAIDRRTGTVADGQLFTEETIAPGARVLVRLLLDRATRQERDARELDVAAAVVEAVARDGLRLGAGWGHGYGGTARLARSWALELRAPTSIDELRELTDVMRLVTTRAWPVDGSLSLRPPVGECFASATDWADRREARAVWLPAPAVTRVELSLRTATGSAVMMLDSGASDAFAHVPETRDLGDGKRALVLHGTGLRGVLRGHAERILTTAIDAARAPGGDATDLSVLGKVLPTDVLFGVSDVRHRLLGLRNDTAEAWLPGAGALRVEELVGRSFDLDDSDWRTLIRSPEITETVRAGVSAIHWSDTEEDPGPSCSALKMRTMLPRSPWTGGGLSTGPFTRLEPGGPSFETAALELRHDRLPLHDGPMVGAAATLLAMVLCDWADGALDVGFGGSRGLGKLTPTALTVGDERQELHWERVGDTARLLTAAVGADDTDVAGATSAWSQAIERLAQSVDRAQTAAAEEAG